MFKDKNFLLKKKILGQKNNLWKLNEELRKDRENLENVKTRNSTIIQQLKDDMLIIKTEWEKKCNEQVICQLFRIFTTRRS